MTAADELVTYTGPKDTLAAFLAGETVTRKQAAFDNSEWVKVRLAVSQMQAMLEMLDLPQ
jgi:hypothetical protein